MPWAPTPATRTLTNLLNEIGNYIGAPSDTSLQAVIVDFLNDGVNRINVRERWPWLLATENVTLVAGTASYTLTTTSIARVRHVHLVDSNGKEVGALLYKEPKTFALEHWDRSTNGSPGFYTAFNLNADGKIDLSVPPDNGFVSKYPTLKLRLVKRLENFFYTSLTDTIVVLGGGPKEVESFLSWHAKALAAMHAGYSDKVTFAVSQAETMYRELVAQSNREWDFD